LKPNRSKRLRELIARDPDKFFWPAVIEVMLELGWKPPPLESEALDHILDDLGGLGNSL